MAVGVWTSALLLLAHTDICTALRVEHRGSDLTRAVTGCKDKQVLCLTLSRMRDHSCRLDYSKTLGCNLEASTQSLFSNSSGEYDALMQGGQQVRAV